MAGSVEGWLLSVVSVNSAVCQPCFYKGAENEYVVTCALGAPGGNRPLRRPNSLQFTWYRRAAGGLWTGFTAIRVQRLATGLSLPSVASVTN